MENKDRIQEAIKVAQEAASAASPELKQKAFEVVLSHLLGDSGTTPANPILKLPAKNTPLAQPAAAETQGLDIARIATQLGLTEEQAADLYQMKGDVLHVGIRPIGARIGERQRNLAHALVVGYRLGLNIKDVSISTINDAAEEWNIRDSNLGRNLQDSNFLQAKGGGKGKKPTYSLAPNSIERAAAEIHTMFA